MAEINFDPAKTLNGQNTFQKETQGLIQGAYMDDPTSRLWLDAGIIDSSVTQAVWGGMPITENVPSLANNTNQYAANPLILPSTVGAITGFTTFNQAHNMMIVPGNSVPHVVANQNIAYFRLRSNIRLPVKISSGLATAVEGGAINQQVTWDFTNHELKAWSSGDTALDVKILKVQPNSKIVNYDSSTGALTWSYGDAALILL